MTPISRLVAVSVYAVLVVASSPVALSQAAQGSSDERQEFSSLLAKAEKGDADAQYRLGVMYFNGEGVPKNDAEAYFWWNLAAAQGNENAKTNRDIVEKKMTREQIAEAQRRSAAWKPKKE